MFWVKILFIMGQKSAAKKRKRKEKLKRAMDRIIIIY
jgi:hypothetical protein